MIEGEGSIEHNREGSIIIYIILLASELYNVELDKGNSQSSDSKTQNCSNSVAPKDFRFRGLSCYPKQNTNSIICRSKGRW